MTEAQAMPIAIAVGLLCILILRSREVTWWVGGLFFLWGFTMASTTPGLTITDFLQWAVYQK